MTGNRKTLGTAANQRCLYIDLQSGSEFILRNITKHHNSDHVIVRKSSPVFDENRGEQGGDFASLEAVSVMDNLRRLDLVSFEGGELSVRCLAIVVKNAKKLHTLRLDAVRVTGEDQEFEEFVRELNGHLSLTELYLGGCLKESFRIQSMAEVLAGLRRLQVVEIIEARFSPIWDGKALATLCQSTSLKALKIRGNRLLRDNHIIEMAQELKYNQALEELCLVCDIGEDAVLAICDMLRSNDSVRVLNLNRIMDGSQATEIAAALAENNSLQRIRLYFLHCAVKKLRASFLPMVEKNCTLEKVEGGWACQDIEFFLRLNRAGRKRLMAGAHKASPSDWVDVLASQKDDLHALHYLMAQNPSLCH